MKLFVVMLCAVALMAMVLVMPVIAAQDYDLNDDGVVDVRDISIVGRAYGSTPGHPRWNEVADVNRDEVVDILDISAVARHFGETL